MGIFDKIKDLFKKKEELVEKESTKKVKLHQENPVFNRFYDEGLRQNPFV